MNRVSVVMVSRHTCPALWLAVESALEQPECHELVLVDNGNIPGVKAVLEKRAQRDARLKIIAGNEFFGPAKSYATGVRATSAPMLLLMSPHCMLPEGCFARALEALAKQPENTLAGCHLINPDGSDMESVLPPGETLPDAFLMLSRGFYDRLGGLSATPNVFGGELGLSSRVHKAGGQVLRVPHLKAICFPDISDAIGPVPLKVKHEVNRTALIYQLTRFSPNDNTLTGKTILVGGGSGQVGLSIVGKALARGAKVIATYNKTIVPFSHPNLEWVQWNRAKGMLEGYSADLFVYTLALWTLPDVLVAVHNSGIRRVVAYGSTSLFGKAGSANAYEQDIREKLQSSEEEVMQLAAERDMAVTLLRPTMIYGVGLDSNITLLANNIRRFGFIAVHGKASGLRHPVQAQDLAQAALDAAFSPATYGKRYNLGGAEPMRYRDMLVALFRYLGKKPRIFRIPFMPALLDMLGKKFGRVHVTGEMARRMNQNLAFDMNDAMEDFGYRPKGFLEGYIVV